MWYESNLFVSYHIDTGGRIRPGRRNIGLRSALERRQDSAAILRNSSNQVNLALKGFKDAGKALGKIQEGVAKVASLVEEISAAGREQANGIEQINHSITQLDSVTQSNAANAEESASASEELSAQAKELQSAVDELQGLVGGNLPQTTRKEDFQTGSRPAGDRERQRPAAKASKQPAWNHEVTEEPHHV